MELKKIKSITIFFLVGILLASCVKTEEKQSNNLLLTNRGTKGWINYSYKVNGVEQYEKSCQRYSIWSFSSDGNIKVEPGLVRCAQAELTIKHTFFFGSTQSDVIFINYTDKYDPVTGNTTTSQLYKYKIETLTRTDLVISTQYLSLDGSSAIVKTYYFKIDE